MSTHNTTHLGFRMRAILMESLVVLAVGCDPGYQEEDGGASSESGTTTGMVGTSDGGTTTSTTTGAPATSCDPTDGTTGEPETTGGDSCPTAVPVGPSLLDAGTCISQADATVLAECRPALSAFRPCDSAFLEWCNENGGDVIGCEADEEPNGPAECGNSPAFLPCDQGFTDACDAMDAEVVCYDDVCTFGRCTNDDLADKFCCDDVSSMDGIITGTGCKAVGNVGFNLCGGTGVICAKGVFKDGNLVC